MKKLLFVFDIDDEEVWRDGLWAALELLSKEYEITKWNVFSKKRFPRVTEYDFLLVWTSFSTDMDRWAKEQDIKKGLCIGGYTYEPIGVKNYDVLFTETEWYRVEISHHPNVVHAFGVNTDIFHPIPGSVKLFDYLTVGAFASWKRQVLIISKLGVRLAIGKSQEGEAAKESIQIMGRLISRGVGVMEAVSSETLAKFYNASSCVFLPADIQGGSERSLLEARACEIPVEIAPDNPKLEELLTCPVYDHHYYAAQLKKGIESA